MKLERALDRNRRNIRTEVENITKCLFLERWYAGTIFLFFEIRIGGSDICVNKVKCRDQDIHQGQEHAGKTIFQKVGYGEKL